MQAGSCLIRSLPKDIERAAAVLCRQMVTVVLNCHSMGVMHRDLKPEKFLFFGCHGEFAVKG